MGKRSSSYKSQVQILRRRVATEAALATFAENGCFSTSMQDVAERAGMATGTLYADHASKVELLEDAFSEAMAEIRTRLSVGETGGGARRDLTQLTEWPPGAPRQRGAPRSGSGRPPRLQPSLVGRRRPAG